jgi:hypothetical protein
VLGDDQVIEDGDLSQLLQPFRRHRPLRMRCPRTGCGRTIVWCAIHPELAWVVFSKNGPRKGHVESANKTGPEHWRQSQPPSPYDYWSLGPSAGADSAIPATPTPGDHKRWTFKCRKCGATYTLTHRTLLTHIVRALTGNRKEFSP